MSWPVKLVAEPDVAVWLGRLLRWIGTPGTSQEPGEARVQHRGRGVLLDAAVLFAGRIVEPAHDERVICCSA